MGRHVTSELLVGRAYEVDRLRSLATGVIDRTGGAVLVQGEPGIGKSALLTAGLADAAGLDHRVLWGACDEMGSRFPAQALLQCLTSNSDDRPRVGAPPFARGNLRGRPVTAVVEGLIAMVEGHCKDSPLVLVLDDLQWADAASLRAWRRLCRLAQRMPLLLVAACRPVPRRPELAFLRDDIAAGIVTSIRLGPLPHRDVVDLVTAAIGHAPRPEVRRLADLAGGNPRFVLDVVAALRRDGPGDEDRLAGQDGLADADDGVAAPTARPLPASLPAIIMERLGYLSEDTIQMLRMAALLGVEFPAADLRAIVGTDTRALEEACAAGVLTASYDRLRFRHPLIQRSIYEAAPASLRLALHRHVAEILAAYARPIERVAKHLLVVPDAMDGWALTWLAAKGAELTRRVPRTSATLHQRALDHLTADDVRRKPAEANLASAWRTLARFDDLERLTRLALARPCDPEHAARMTWLRAFALMHIRPLDGLSLTANPMLGAELEQRWVARLDALRALILGLTGRFDESSRAAERALAIAGWVADGVAAGYALHAMAIEASRSDLGRAMSLTEQALAAAGDDPDAAELRLVLLSDQTRAFDHIGMRTKAEEALRDALSLAGRVSMARHVGVRIHTATHWYEVGDWDEAQAELNLIEEVPEKGDLPVRLHGLQALIAGHRDDRDTVRRHLGKLHDRAIPTEVMRRYGQHLVLARALAAEREGQPERALETLAWQFGRERHDDVRSGYYYGLAELVRLALAVDNHPFALTIVEASEADARRQPDSPKRAAVASRCRGLVSSDPTLLLAAADYFHAANDPFELAATLEDAADVHGERGEVAAARLAFTKSVSTYLELGAAWDIRRAESRVRPYGIGRGQHGPRRRPALGWHALTPTEVKVARLVAAGLSNPEIAAELFLSRRTVQSHVSHILAKLQARSRGEIAHAVAEHTDGSGVPEGLAS